MSVAGLHLVLRVPIDAGSGPCVKMTAVLCPCPDGGSLTKGIVLLCDRIENGQGVLGNVL